MVFFVDFPIIMQRCHSPVEAILSLTTVRQHQSCWRHQEVRGHLSPINWALMDWTCLPSTSHAGLDWDLENMESRPGPHYCLPHTILEPILQRGRTHYPTERGHCREKTLFTCVFNNVTGCADQMHNTSASHFFLPIVHPSAISPWRKRCTWRAVKANVIDQSRPLSSIALWFSSDAHYRCFRQWTGRDHRDLRDQSAVTQPHSQ